MEILSFNQIDRKIQDEVTNQIKNIFYSCSSVKNFRDDEHKISFFNKWCGDYLKNSSQFFLLAMEGQEVIGYLSGYLDSKQALSNFIIPGPEVFEDCFDDFPAHFHINCAPNHQGKGIGRKLVEAYIQLLSETSVNGVHLITSTDANNLGFYRALGFSKEILRPFKSHELLLMGKELSA